MADAPRDCRSCRFASWQRTKAGRLHPSQAGRCTWEGWKAWAIPSAFHFLWRNRDTPTRPDGGYITRSAPHAACPCWEAIPPDPPTPCREAMPPDLPTHIPAAWGKLRGSPTP